jgi:hypothetical protein
MLPKRLVEIENKDKIRLREFDNGSHADMSYATRKYITEAEPIETELYL